LVEKNKVTPFILLGILSLIQGILIYFNVNGQIEAVILPMIAYFFGIVTKTGVDVIKKK
jgi:hypothetical protein